MKTIEERAKAASEGYDDDGYTAGLYMGYVVGATAQKAIDEANPSDAVIMRILNAIGYEEESWIPIVRKNLETMEG